MSAGLVLPGDSGGGTLPNSQGPLASGACRGVSLASASAFARLLPVGLRAHVPLPLQRAQSWAEATLIHLEVVLTSLQCKDPFSKRGSRSAWLWGQGRYSGQYDECSPV